jgi:hypothetical protein
MTLLGRGQLVRVGRSSNSDREAAQALLEAREAELERHADHIWSQEDLPGFLGWTEQGTPIQSSSSSG